MKGYFATKGTGDIGDVLEMEDGTSLKKEKRLNWKNYFRSLANLVSLVPAIGRKALMVSYH